MSYDHWFDRMNDFVTKEGEQAPLDENGRVLRKVGKDQYEPTGKRPLTRAQIRAAMRKEMDARIPDLQGNVLDHIEPIIPGYDRVPSSERSHRQALSERARAEVLDHLEDTFYGAIPSKSSLIRRADNPTRQFIENVLNMDVDDPALGGVSYREMRTTEDPAVRQRFYTALFKRLDELLDREVREVTSLTDEEAVARFRKTASFNGLLFELESIYSNHGLDEIPELMAIKERLMDNQDTISIAFERVTLIANPLYRDLPLEQGMSYSAPDLIAASVPFLEDRRASPENSNRYEYFNDMGALRQIASLGRGEYLCNLLNEMGYKPERQPKEMAKDFLKRVGIKAIFPNGQTLEGEPLIESLDGVKPVLLQLPGQEGVPSRLVSLLPSRTPFDTLLHNKEPEAYFNYGASERIEALNQQLAAADKRVISGSKEFAGMMHSLTMLGEHFANLQADGGSYQQIKDLLDELNDRSSEYLKFKETQRGLQNGVLVGKSATEQRRIEAAQEVQSFVQEKLGQLNLLVSHPDFSKNMNAQEAARITEAAGKVARTENPSAQLAALENAAQRSARELARMTGQNNALSNAEKADVRLHMARLVVNEVVHLQGERGGMMNLYNESPAKFLNAYANSKEFKSIANDPRKLAAFVAQNGANVLANNIVDSLAVRMGEVPEGRQPQERAPQEQMNLGGPQEHMNLGGPNV